MTRPECAPWDHIYTWCYLVDWPWGLLLPRVRRCIWCNSSPRKGNKI